jgi:nucleoside phosphorylase
MDKDNVIGLLFATMTEAKPFVKGMSLKKTENTPFSVFEKARIEDESFEKNRVKHGSFSVPEKDRIENGPFSASEKGRIENGPFSASEKGRIENGPFSASEKGRIVLVISGIGKANGAMATAYCCQTFHPTLICNLGAAGATDDSFVLGDILHITEAIEYDRPELRSNKPHVFAPHIMEGFSLAKVATQDTPVIDADKRKEIALIAGLVDMEAASIIQACDRFQTRCVIFKFVSDTPDHAHGDDIVTNIKEYRTSFFDFFKEHVMLRLFAEHGDSKDVMI